MPAGYLLMEVWSIVIVLPESSTGLLDRLSRLPLIVPEELPSNVIWSAAIEPPIEAKLPVTYNLNLGAMICDPVIARSSGGNLGSSVGSMSTPWNVQLPATEI